MIEPIKEALGRFMVRYYDSLVPTTKPLDAFVRRGAAKSIAWAPGRMVDSAEEMLRLWLRSDVKAAGTTQPPDLPVIMVAVAKDYIPSGREYTRQIADANDVVIEQDPKERVFALRTAAGDIRTQVVFFATDEPSARSLAAQFLLFLDATPNRRFESFYPFAGQVTDWPIQIEAPDVPAQSIESEAKNLTILAVDLTLKATIPFFSAPRAGEPNDGKGEPGTDDPAGFPRVARVTIKSAIAGPQAGTSPIRDYSINWPNVAEGAAP